MWIPRAKETCGQVNFSHHRKQLLYSNRWRSYIREPLDLIHLNFQNLKRFPGKDGFSTCPLSSKHFLQQTLLCFFQQAAQVVAPLLLYYSLLNLAEIADGSLAFASHNDALQFSVSSIKPDGNSRGRPPRKSSASGRTEKEDEDSKTQSSVRKQHMSSNQAEIMALFRRIQSSISEGESTDTKKKKASRSEKSPTDSILEVLRHSRKHAKGPSTVGEGKKVLTQERSVPEDQKMQAEHALKDVKLTRPPSNFTKKSPIPSPSTSRENTTEMNSESSEGKASNHKLELPGVEKMKLAELKELAKSMGIKGYSKLKKCELVELLRS